MSILWFLTIVLAFNFVLAVVALAAESRPWIVAPGVAAIAGAVFAAMLVAVFGGSHE